jgi:hypothetical protein
VVHPLAGPSNDAERTGSARVRSRHVEESRRRHRDRVERITQIVSDDAKDFFARVDDSLRFVIETVHRHAPDLVHHHATYHIGDAEGEDAG